MSLFAENGISIDSEQILDQGDLQIKYYFDIETYTEIKLKNGNKVFSLSGGHSVTFPIIKAYHKLYPKLVILHIDAHVD